jgi:mono/diheme cytochrome c family protein
MLLLLSLCSACGASDGQATDPTLIDALELDFPTTLSEVGLYANQATLEPSKRAVPYTPRAPLWSNGLEKERFLVVPEGETIDASDSVWAFPKNTLFFKTFLGEDGPIETRVLRTTDTEPEFATYRWDGDEAFLLGGERSIEVEVTLGDTHTPHEIPSTRSCQQCHESAASPVLGFGPLQLSGQDADSEEQVERLANAGIISAEPELDAALDGFEGTELQVLGYFAGNCVHCHNGTGGIASSFDLSPKVAFDTIIDQQTESSASAAGVRVVSGDAEASILFQAVSGETDNPEVKSMPPVGVQRRDQASIEVLRTWIDAL